MFEFPQSSLIFAKFHSNAKIAATLYFICNNEKKSAENADFMRFQHSFNFRYVLIFSSKVQ